MGKIAGVFQGLIVTALLVLSFSPAHAQSATPQCGGHIAPRQTIIWANLTAYVKRVYRVDTLRTEDKFLAYGHAFGRLALAVDGDPERRQALDCVQIGIDQAAMLATVNGHPNHYRLAMEAAHGMHNGRVAQATGVTAMTALTGLFPPKRVALQTLPPRRPPPRVTPPRKQSVAQSRPQPLPVCLDGADGRWSLTAARTALNTAAGLLPSIPGDCIGDGWFACKAVVDQLMIAREHLFQTFNQNHEGLTNCRKCDFGPVHDMASELVWWQDLMISLYYNLSGFHNVYYVIGDHLNDKVCTSNRRPPPDVEVDARDIFGTNPTPPPSRDIRPIGAAVTRTAITQCPPGRRCRCPRSEVTMQVSAAGIVQQSVSTAPATRGRKQCPPLQGLPSGKSVPGRPGLCFSCPPGTTPSSMLRTGKELRAQWNLPADEEVCVGQSQSRCLP